MGKIYLIKQMTPQFINTGKVKVPETVANAFNNFFLTITGNLNLHKVRKEDTISFF
jgi:hypothetical protein